MPTDEGRVLRLVHTYSTVVIALALVLVGGVLLYLSGLAFLHDQPTWQVFIRELGSLVVVTGGITLLWDLKERRNFANEVLAQAQVGADIRASGLRRLSMHYLEDVEWSNLFQTARELEVFLSYGATWRGAHWTKLKEYCRRPGNKLRVYLPDPQDEVTVAALALRYAYTSEGMKQRIEEAAYDFASLRHEGGASDIRIYYRRGDPAFACYRFDGQIVVTLYSHTRSRADVPTMLVEQGTLYDFFVHELEAVRDQSEEVPGQQLREGEA
jgi:hypothetical protein